MQVFLPFSRQSVLNGISMNQPFDTEMLFYFAIIVNSLPSDAEDVRQPGLNGSQLNHFDNKNPLRYFIEKINRFNERAVTIELRLWLIAPGDSYSNPFSEMNQIGVGS